MKFRERVFEAEMAMCQQRENNPFTQNSTYFIRQFLIRPCFSMSKNKAFNFVGVYLPEDVFVHEQLCVANSRVMSLSVVVVYVEAYQGNGSNAA